MRSPLPLRLLVVFTLLFSGTALAEERLTLWVKGFIPNSHPKNPGLVRPVPGRPGQTMIPGVKLDPGCYLTDNRGFSDDINASARLMTAFTVTIDGANVRIAKLPGKPEFSWSNQSERLDCATGQVLAAATAKPQVPVTGEKFNIGGPHVAGDDIQIIFQAAAKNPVTPILVPSGVTPTIDYSLDLIYHKQSGRLDFKGTLGRFPAFEAYVSRNGDKPRPLFRVMPEGDGPSSLVDLGTGFGSRNIDGHVSLKDLK